MKMDYINSEGYIVMQVKWTVLIFLSSRYLSCYKRLNLNSYIVGFWLDFGFKTLTTELQMLYLWNKIESGQHTVLCLAKLSSSWGEILLYLPKTNGKTLYPSNSQK